MNLTEIEEQARTDLVAGRDEQAYQLLGKIIAADANHAPAYYLLSLIAHKYRNYDREVSMLRRAASLAPYNLAYQCHLARALALSGNTLQAKQTLDSVDLSRLDEAALIDVVATTFNRLNLYESACRWYEKLIALDAGNPYAWFNLGACYKYVGRFGEAKFAFQQALKRKPNYEKALAALSSLSAEGDPKHMVQLRAQMDRTEHPDAKLHLAHALARELEASGDYAEAFAALIAAKTLKRASLGARLPTDRESLFKCLTQTDLAIQSGAGSIEHIFVVGMPRSGTTLVERIVSGAPGIASGGELYNFSAGLKKAMRFTGPQFIPPRLPEPRELDQAANHYRESTSYLHRPGEVLLDKLPLNILYTPQILASLKHSVVVCLDRHPLDTIVGNFRQLFSFDDSVHDYSLALADTAHFYCLFRDFMQQMSERHPQRFFTVNYERLVQCPVEEGRKLFGFLGIRWDDHYLNIEENRTPVATASSVQVREKINTRSIGQWQRYNAFLGDAKTVLSEHGISFY